MRLRISSETRHALAGWHVLSAYQIPQRDGRKLDRCAQPSDPWHVTLHDTASPLTASRIRRGIGATPDAAVLAAIPTPLEDEIDKLIGALRGA